MSIKGKEIQFEPQIKFLGMIFDQKLNWSSHIQSIVNKCMKRFNVLKAISGLHWGIDKKTLVVCYQGLIRSIIDYGCEVYDFGYKKYLKKLDTLQNKCLKLCTGAIKGTATEALQVDCGQPPLNLRRSYLQNKLAVKYTKLKRYNEGRI